MSSIPTEKAWLIEVRNFFADEEAEVDLNTPASIFEVPKALKAVKPEAYTPQMIAFGPYHHWSEGVYEMERYKLTIAKRVQSVFESGLKFEDLVEKLVRANLKIRACYHKYLTIDGECLAWMMAIDGLFLLQFLHIYVNRNESVLANSARMSFFIDANGRKLGYDSILKDIMMLENQIPLFVMKKILTIQASTKAELFEDILPRMLRGVCVEIAPLKLIMSESHNSSQFLKQAHLLDLLYYLMVPKCEQALCPPQNRRSPKNDSEGIKAVPHPHQYRCTPNDTRVFKELWDRLSGFTFSQSIIKYINPFGKIASMIADHFGFSKHKSENRESSNGQGVRIEKIMIPTVTELANVGVRFQPTNGDISTINFERRHKVFHLPVIKLDVNSEVIMRNLVAYEASARSMPLVFARYAELMNGIVDTGEDVKILAESGIIKSELSYEEVAGIWDGMSKSIRLSHVQFIDETIEEVNRYYYNTPRVRFYMTMKAYVYRSWRMLVVLATLMVIALMCIQSFCSVYDCPRILHSVAQKN